MTPEGRRKAHLKKAVKAAGGECRKVVWQGRRGAPDWLVWWPGPVTAFVELKADSVDDLSALQANEIRILRRDGWCVYVCSSNAEIDRAIWELTHPKGCVK